MEFSSVFTEPCWNSASLGAPEENSEDLFDAIIESCGEDRSWSVSRGWSKETPLRPEDGGSEVPEAPTASSDMTTVRASSKSIIVKQDVIFLGSCIDPSEDDLELAGSPQAANRDNLNIAYALTGECCTVANEREAVNVLDEDSESSLIVASDIDKDHVHKDFLRQLLREQAVLEEKAKLFMRHQEETWKLHQNFEVHLAEQRHQMEKALGETRRPSRTRSEVSVPKQPDSGVGVSQTGTHSGTICSVRTPSALMNLATGFMRNSNCSEHSRREASRRGSSVGYPRLSKSRTKEDPGGDLMSRRSERIRQAYDKAKQTNSKDQSKYMERITVSHSTITKTLAASRVLGSHRIGQWVNSKQFGLGVCSLISLNAVLIAITSDMSMKDSIVGYDNGSSGEDAFLMAQWIFWAEAVFNMVFFVELVLRVVALELEFCMGKEWAWNIFDALVVLFSFFEMVMVFVGFTPSLIRLLRLARVARSMRMLRLVRFTSLVRKLRMMTLAISQCRTMLMWATLVLLIDLFLFAVVFINGASLYIALASNSDPYVDDMKVFFGSLPMTMLTLFMAVTGGLDWWEVVKLLLEIHFGYGVLFLLFVVITVLAVLNVISAIFVNDAMEAARMDVDLRMQTEHDQTKLMIETLTSIFNELSGHSGVITLETFVTQVEREDMRLFCSFVGLHHSDMETLFKLLDVDGDGHMGIDEFVMGCLRLKGTSILVEMNVAMHETAEMMRTSILENRRTMQVCTSALQTLLDRLHSPASNDAASPRLRLS